MEANRHLSAALALRGVSKRYRGGPLILDGIDLTVARGEFVSLLGPSGSGKSTLLKLIAGLTTASAGSIEVDGMTPADARETISYIFQDPTLLPWRTVADNVGLALELDRVPLEERQRRVRDLLELVKLSHASRRYPRELSGGMKMRVSIARALATRPRLLLMDEPFAALDEISRDHLNQELLHLYEEQQFTVVFVTHSVAEAVFLSSRVVLLAANPGRVSSMHSVQFAPRRDEALRANPAFEQAVTATSRALREARELAPAR